MLVQRLPSVLSWQYRLEVAASLLCCCRYVPSQKVYATCEGPKVTLAYVPKVCILDEATQQVSGQALVLGLA